ncbi:MAG: SDR family NAD(P)-dependent oxidoreductase, partial [Lachnospiraceae bacterium]|nr:SDR family NAD(P)-dependent oxidoreductase [Lachnospiraceae bacterium]
MKTALITGASRGIGRACAIELSKDYELIAICCKENKDKLEETASSIKQNNCEVITFTGDVSDYDFVSDMVSSIINKSGKIDTLINNAGIASIGLFTDVTPSDWQKMIDTNLTSIYNTCHAVIPHMIHKKCGHIINVSSVWGLVGASCEVCYSATKGAINSFTKALAKELAPSNISVNAVAFGAVDTDMNSCLSEEDRISLCEEIPYGRMATAKEAGLFISRL